MIGCDGWSSAGQVRSRQATHLNLRNTIGRSHHIPDRIGLGNETNHLAASHGGHRVLPTASTSRSIGFRQR
jgi:hypothetical protein